MIKVPFRLTLIFFISLSCSTDDQSLFDPNAERNPLQINHGGIFADANLCQEARDLHSKLLELTQRGIAFGQQAPFGTGNNFPMPDKLDPDFKDVAMDYPAIVGFDLELIGRQPDVDPFIEKFTKAVIDAHENGSIITMSWHATNPNNLGFGNFGDMNNVVPKMLENGEFRDLFLMFLERVARVFNGLKDAEGKPIPVLFRPWHEMNGDFFYWGEGFRTTEEYIQLYRDTVRILSEELDVHNVLYMYAPNWLSSPEEYLRNYPGDQYVDMLGIDVYDFKNGRFLENALNNLRIVESIANEKNMLFALSETGLENVTQNNWWTENLYKAIRSSSITYALIWRNDSSSFFHAPFLGHPAVDDFRTFLDKDIILLSEGIR
ncbi:glycoside hydrolase family 26 protein [Aquimarina sp. D1M17]|uniref:glycoside hydrolase family 26 protein n=1 Tax=Aquimarina acroporae TaxID=2937283 RepID=UPI0020BD5510|nr:glycosyl hydrolase [Aquimarina acroporae]MCK8521271.1 glycoside hydrolase family 26 protein [Aquimarina acroporae]